MKIVIIGAGNLGVVCAARFAAQGEAVVLLTDAPNHWPSVIAAEDCNGGRFEGPLEVTNDAACVSGADLILLCLPGCAMRSKLTKIVRYIQKGTPIASVFSGDGFFFIVEELLGAQWPVLGFQRVPFICRTKVPYRLGGILGYRKELFLAHRNIANLDQWRANLESVLGTRTTILDNFYEAALINGNVVMHPARLMSLRANIDKNGPFQRMPLFYEEWDDLASEWAIRLDEEVCAVAAAKGVHLTPFLEYYESRDASSLTRKIRSISAFRGLASPILPNGQIDHASRYIQSDIGIALKMVSEIAFQLHIKVAVAREIVESFKDEKYFND